jgi:hypothetical protein
VFRHQFETVAEHNCWTCQKKSTYLITALQGQATDMLHGDLKARPMRKHGRPLQRPASCLHVSQSAKNKDPRCQGILARIYHSHWTAHPQHLTLETRRKASKRHTGTAKKVRMVTKQQSSGQEGWPNVEKRVGAGGKGRMP